MDYTINVHNNVIIALDTFPALIKAEIIRKFEMIITGGHTFIPPYEIKYGTGKNFTIYANTNRADNDFKNCAVLIGFFTDKGYYIDEIRRIENHICQTTNKDLTLHSPRHIYDIKDRPIEVDEKEFTFIDRNWISSMINEPFIKKSYHDILSRTKVAMTIPMELEYRFYDSLSTIECYIKQCSLAASLRPFPYVAENDKVIHKVFDQNLQSNNASVSACELLEANKPKKQEIHVINWIDETDKWNGIQRELFGFIVCYLKCLYPNLSVTVIDIIIRDDEGNEPYYQEFLTYRSEIEYLGNAPTPFTTISSRAFAHDPTVVSLADNGVKHTHFDLFNGCREFSNEIPFKEQEKYNKIYRKNLRGIIHEVLKVSGLATDYALSRYKDVRGMTREEIDQFTFDLEYESVAIVVHGDNEKTFLAASYACSNAMLRGMPHVVVVRVDGKDGVADVRDHSGKYMQLVDVIDSSDGYVGALIHLIEEIYWSHQLHAVYTKFQHPYRSKLKTPLFLSK